MALAFALVCGLPTGRRAEAKNICAFVQSIARDAAAGKTYVDPKTGERHRYYVSPSAVSYCAVAAVRAAPAVTG